MPHLIRLVRCLMFPADVRPAGVGAIFSDTGCCQPELKKGAANIRAPFFDDSLFALNEIRQIEQQFL